MPGEGSDGDTASGAPAPVSRYYWDAFFPEPDPLAYLCGTPTNEAGTERWERLIDRQTGDVVTTRTRCLPIDLEVEATPDPPSPAQIWESVPVPSPAVHLDPAGAGVTGLDTYLWYEGPTTLAVDATLDGWTVVGNATVQGIRWTTGDGGSVSSSRAGGPVDPAATYRYERKSGAQPYEVTATVTWHGTATISGYGVTLEEDLGTVTRTGSRPYEVDEVRAVLRE